MFTRAVIFSCYENEESIKINVMYSFHLYSLKGYSFLSLNCSNEDFVAVGVKARAIFCGILIVWIAFKFTLYFSNIIQTLDVRTYKYNDHN